MSRITRKNLTDAVYDYADRHALQVGREPGQVRLHIGDARSAPYLYSLVESAAGGAHHMIAGPYKAGRLYDYLTWA